MAEWNRHSTTRRRRFAHCTRVRRSSSRTPGTRGRPRPSPRSASRHLRVRAPGSRSRSGAGTDEPHSKRWSTTRGGWIRQPACRSRSISRTATARLPSTQPLRSTALRRPARSAARSRTTTPSGRIYDIAQAAERVAAACEAARLLDFPFLVTGRAENHIRGNPDLDDTIARLQAYEQAGADVLYAPGLRTAEEIRLVCEATNKPVNVLARPNLSMSEIATAGAIRISVGGALTWVAMNAVIAAAERMRDDGDFSDLAGLARDVELD
jgi:Phosphoenolpyruvate phosphomutase